MSVILFNLVLDYILKKLYFWVNVSTKMVQIVLHVRILW